MFVGHYSASFAAKLAGERIPLWVLVGATQLLDTIWCVLVILGVETIAGDPSRTEGLDFTYYPYSHSLVAALFWSVLVFGLAKAVWRTGCWSAALIAAVVFSHWLLDLVVHHADLPLWPGTGPRIGLAGWDLGIAEQAGELLVLAAAAAAWAARRNRWLPAMEFVAAAALLMIGSSLTRPRTPVVNPLEIGLVGLATYGSFTLLAFFIERQRTGRRRAGRMAPGGRFR